MRRSSSTILVLACILVACARAKAAPASDDDMGRRVQRLLRAHQAEIYACVQKQTGVVEGEALLRVVVGDGGAADRVEVLKADSTPGVRGAADCVAAAARHWALLPLGAEGGEQVVFPLVFRPEPSRTDAIAVHVEELTLPRKTMFLSLSHVAALYVIGPNGLGLVYSMDGSFEAGVGDVVLAQPQRELSFVGAGSSRVLRIDATADSARQPGPLVERLEASKIPTLPLPGGQGTVQLYLDGKAAPFAVDRLCAKRGAIIPRHQHDADEVVYLISGRVRVADGDRLSVFGPRDIMTIPRGTPHAIVVTEDMCAVQVYAPAGPEQRFKRTTP